MNAIHCLSLVIRYREWKEEAKHGRSFSQIIQISAKNLNKYGVDEEEKEEDRDVARK